MLFLNLFEFRNIVVIPMVLKTGPGREPEKGVVPVSLVDRGPTGGRTGDVINNLINNLIII
jgi:hypothetical protein